MTHWHPSMDRLRNSNNGTNRLGRPPAALGISKSHELASRLYDFLTVYKATKKALARKNPKAPKILDPMPPGRGFANQKIAKTNDDFANEFLKQRSAFLVGRAKRQQQGGEAILTSVKSKKSNASKQANRSPSTDKGTFVNPHVRTPLAQQVRFATREFIADYTNLIAAYKAENMAVAKGDYGRKSGPVVMGRGAETRQFRSRGSLEHAAMPQKRIKEGNAKKVDRPSFDRSSKFRKDYANLVAEYNAKKRAIATGDYGSKIEPLAVVSGIEIKHFRSPGSPGLAATLNKQLKDTNVKRVGQARLEAFRDLSYDYAALYAAYKAEKVAIAKGDFGENKKPLAIRRGAEIKHFISPGAPELASALNKHLKEMNAEKTRQAHLGAYQEFKEVYATLVGEYKARKRSISKGEFGDNTEPLAIRKGIEIKHFTNPGAPGSAATANRPLKGASARKARQARLEAYREFKDDFASLVAEYRAKKKSISKGEFGDNTEPLAIRKGIEIKHFISPGAPELAAALNKHLKETNAKKARQAQLGAFREFKNDYVNLIAEYQAKKKSIAKGNY